MMMKKTILIGALAAAFIVTGGTGLYIASAKDTPVNQASMMQELGIDYDQMANMMGTGNLDDMQNYMEEQGVDLDEMKKFMEDGNINFGQMKPLMSKMHPNLDNKELEEMYKSMHGTGGASQSSNF